MVPSIRFPGFALSGFGRPPRRRRLIALGAALTLGSAVALYAIATAQSPVPFVNPLVEVRTESGGVVRVTPVPVGGAPVPIDVDDGQLLGALQPDILVSVPVVDLEELQNGTVVVPQVVVQRLFLATQLGHPTPPLKIDAKVEIQDAAHGFSEIATVNYGFETLGGSRMPPLVRAKLSGPIESGFTDPLEGTIEAPGYNGPLRFNVRASTPDLNATFNLGFDPLPERIHFIEDPREDGLDFSYDHAGPIPDVKLDAAFDLEDRSDGSRIQVGAVVERLPQQIKLSNTNTAEQTLVEYDSQTQLAKPDLEASYRDLDPDGGIVTDANVKVAGLPPKMRGTVDTVPDGAGGSEVTGVDFRVLEGGAVDAIDFLVRNWAGDPGPVPEPALGPDQFAAVATRRMPDGNMRYRAAGRIQDVRSITYEKLEDDGLDVTTDLGDGVTPLRAILDLDDRGPGAPDDARRIKVDTRVTPLPSTIHTRFIPGGGEDPIQLLYEAAQPVDIDADAVIAEAGNDGCGQAEVICATARIDKLPARLEMDLPGPDGRDFRISHTGGDTNRPDVRAKIDLTPEDAADRTFVDAAILRVPNEVRGRLDTSSGVLKAAEFHGCTWDFESESCTDAQGALGRVTFTVRDQPSREGLPPRPDTVPTFVTLLKRDDRFEVTGRVDEVRNVVFRQRDENEDGQPDGTLGARVDAGGGDPFDAKVDQVTGSERTRVDVGVDALPTDFSACFREAGDAQPPADVGADSLLSPCDRTDVLGRAAGELDSTPLSVVYKASSPTKVAAHVISEAPDPDDGNRPATDEIATTIENVPSEARADVIPPITPGGGNPGRKLELGYTASSRIDKIDLDFQTRRSNSICEDPRPDRKAICLSATLKDLPSTVLASYDPDDAKGDIDFRTAAPRSGDPRMSIDPLRLSIVEPGPEPTTLVVDGRILSISDHLAAKLQKADLDGDGKKDLGRINFNACPDGPCGGIGEIFFTATNSVVGDPVPPVPAPDPPEPDLTQEFSFMQRGDDFRAQGHISQLKEVGYAKLEKDSLTPSKTTTLRAAFGDGSPGQKVRAYVDTDDGSEALVADAIVRQAPQAINLCLRDSVDAADVKPDEDRFNFCEKAPEGKVALQTRLDTPATGDKPDIELRRFEQRSGGGTEVLIGSATIDDLAQRIDVLAGKNGDTDVLVEGHDIDDGPGDPPKNVAGRVSFDIRNFRGDGGTSFPYTPLEGALDPAEDTRNDDPAGTPNAGRNYAVVVKDKDSLRLRGSIPAIKRIRMHPGVCAANEGDARFPDPAGFPEAKRPEYTCVNALLAQGRRLGVAVRTLDEKNEILALEEGHLTEVPAGEEGLSATLGKAPEAADEDPVCRSGGSIPCRPPMISLTAPRGDGQGSPTLEGRLATGDQDVVEELRTQEPLDPLSRRLDYEQAPRDYAGNGARIKVGQKDVEENGAKVSRKAVRMGIKIQLPKFVDVDPVTSYSCKRSPSKPDGCDAEDAKKETNQGTEAKDIGIKIVGANNERDGSDVATLGRVAVFVRDLSGGKDVIVTGARSDNLASNGTSPHNPETPAPEGAWDRGFELPGHTDVLVHLRDDFNSDEDTPQQKFVQVDGRVNTPLSLTLRLNENPLGVRRAGGAVSGTQLTLRNAAGLEGLGNVLPNYDNPTFRIRAEIREPWVDPSGPGFFECKGEGLGVDFRALGFGVSACLILPNPETRWLDVQLNGDPDGPNSGNAPARLLEAVVDTNDNNQVDLKAFADSVSKDDAQNWTQQAGLRLEPFDLGVRLGAGFGLFGGKIDLLLNGDLIVGANGLANERTRLSNNAGALRLKSEGGTAKVVADLLERVRFKVIGEALFGLVEEEIVNEATPPFPAPVAFRRCSTGGLFGTVNEFSVTNDSEKSGITLGGGFPSSLLSANFFTGVLDLLPPAFCALTGTSDSALVNANHPAPRFDEPGHPVADVAAQAAPSAPPPPPAADITPPDITVSDTQTMCGNVGASVLRVTGTGRIDVGAEGTTVPTPGGGTIECDGRLVINADRVIVEPGGVISASATRTSNAGGTPGSGAGGGAGHHGNGGAAGGGAGAGGSSYPIPGGGLVNDFGSPGRGGDAAGGGRGGGVISIVADETIRVQGAVAAAGGSGAASAGTGGGGGSGGAVKLTATKVVVSGTVSVRGGNGGAGANGGGGGSGGRVGIETVIKDTPAGTLIAGGGSGAAVDGANGDDGTTALGTDFDRAAGVTRVGTELSPFVTGNSVDLRVSGAQDGGGDFVIIVCRRSVGPGDPDGFESADLDPPSGSSFGSLLGGDCFAEEFDAGDAVNGNEYARTVSLPLSDDGYYGFFAFAAEPPPFPPGINCLNTSFGCDYQDVVPQRATVRLARDSTPPSLDDVEALNGFAGCPSGSLCLSDVVGRARIEASDVTSGLARARCTVSGAPDTEPCGPSPAQNIGLGDSDGLKDVQIVLTDVAGNSQTYALQKWFVDRAAPGAPTITVTNVGPNTNGWFRQKPQVSITASDPAPAGGFGEDPITLEVDEAEFECGGTPAGDSVTCSSAETEPFVPEDGVHTFQATVTDRLNNTSDPSDADPGTEGFQRHEMRVDTTPPTSRFFIGPKQPNGENGWYVTKPFFAFAASDTPGGSGVDLSVAPSAIRYQVDGGSFQTWDPNDDAANQIPDGEHEICWYAIDVAGNEEADGDPKANAEDTNCVDQIKVDSTPPEVSDPITPGAPDGDNSFYTDEPEVNPSGTDALPGSGIDRVEYQIDTGDWEAAAPFEVDEGEHEVRVRGFDVAGNPAGLKQRVVRVDASAPTQRLGAYPPSPNGQDWFRQPVTVSIAASDGRDGSGEDGATYRIDGGGAISYLRPFSVEEGTHDVLARARDRAGLLGSPEERSFSIDHTAPVARPIEPRPNPILLPRQSTTLRFRVTDALAPRVKVRIQIYNTGGSHVRTLPAPGPHPGGFRDTGDGAVTWNGRDARGRGVPSGLYFYRVQAIDQAGNSVLSAESKTFLILLGLLPL